MDDNGNRDMVEAITKQLIDEGRVIEAGWKSMEILVLAPTASSIQRAEMRKAFFAGAQHLFGSMLVATDPEGEPTEEDERRMTMIHRELAGFMKELQAEIVQRHNN